MVTIDPGRIPGAFVIPSCVRVILAWETPNGVPAHNVLHGTVGGGFAPTTAIANTVLDSLSSGATWDTLAAFFSNATTLRFVRLLDMRELSLATVDSTNAGASGTSTDAPMAPSTSLTVTLRTAFAGQAFRGRIYVPGWATNAAAGGGVASSGAAAALQAWAATIPTVFAASGLTLCLAHPARAGYTGSTGAVHAARAASTVPVTELIVRNAKWDSQRKRGGRT